MKKVAIIQARMGSTRLPKKMLLDLAGQPVIGRVFERVAKAPQVDEAWLATTNRPADDQLAAWAEKHQVNCFRGSEDDVLDRYFQTAKAARADVIIRITGDCPLMDPLAIDSVAKAFLAGDCDYACNAQPPTWPDGLDAEAFLFWVLKKAWQEAKLRSEREHATAYIWKHPEIFKIKNVAHRPDLSRHRWTLDTREDYEFIKHIYEECRKRRIFGTMPEVLEILRDNPDWEKLNHHFERNEGYAKSIKED